MRRVGVGSKNVGWAKRSVPTREGSTWARFALPTLREGAVVQLLAALLLGLASLGAAYAQPSSANWASKPIRWIVPYPAGAGTDLISRTITQKLAEVLHQPVVIDNRPGGNTIIGTSAIA